MHIKSIYVLLLEKRAFCPDYRDFVDIWLSRCYNTLVGNGKIFMKTERFSRSTEKYEKRNGKKCPDKTITPTNLRQRFSK